MKDKSSAFSNSRLLMSLLFVSLGCFFALIGFGANSKASADTNRSSGLLQNASATANAQPHSNDLGLFDEKGNRAVGIRPGAALRAKHRGTRPVGTAAWVSLGPPGGDVFDAAVS